MIGNILAGLTDVALLISVRKRASAESVDLAACVTQTLQRYTVQASHEEWITQMGMLNRSVGSAMICQKRAFAYAACTASAA
jgi:hypothetical protein